MKDNVTITMHIPLDLKVFMGKDYVEALKAFKNDRPPVERFPMMEYYPLPDPRDQIPSMVRSMLWSIFDQFPFDEHNVREQMLINAIRKVVINVDVKGE